MSETNDLTQFIIKFFYDFSPRIFCFRQSGLPVPMVKQGAFVGYRPPATTGIPDLQAFIPRGVLPIFPYGGGCIFFEIKTGKDRLRDSQKGFIANAAACQVKVLIIKSEDDFLKQWEQLRLESPKELIPKG